jgi:hypothetical protein
MVSVFSCLKGDSQIRVSGVSAFSIFKIF